ncbi:MAG: hypothetical protein MI717_05160, partial [Spirochaetales bacterium]|nr:hypothetical protein [Spirochaetales bacterium]
MLVSLCLTGHQVLADIQPAGKVDDSPHDQVPQFEEDSTSTWYYEGGSDTHLMLGENYGITFQNRRLSTHLSLVSLYALGTAAVGQFLSYKVFNSDSYLARLVSSTPALSLPAYWGWQSWKQFRSRDERARRHPIHIADDPTLAKRLAIFFEQSTSFQLLELRLPPMSLTGLPMGGG